MTLSLTTQARNDGLDLFHGADGTFIGCIGYSHDVPNSLFKVVFENPYAGHGDNRSFSTREAAQFYALAIVAHVDGLPS